MRAVLSFSPTSNFAVASPGDREDSMSALGRVLMGLSHPVTLISQCRETTEVYDWPTPPRLTRRWLAVVTADTEATLQWRRDSLKKALDGIGLRCTTVDESANLVDGALPPHPQPVQDRCN